MSNGDVNPVAKVEAEKILAGKNPALAWQDKGERKVLTLNLSAPVVDGVDNEVLVKALEQAVFAANSAYAAKVYAIKSTPGVKITAHDKIPDYVMSKLPESTPPTFTIDLSAGLYGHIKPAQLAR